MHGIFGVVGDGDLEALKAVCVCLCSLCFRCCLFVVSLCCVGILGMSHPTRSFNIKQHKQCQWLNTAIHSRVGRERGHV